MRRDMRERLAVARGGPQDPNKRYRVVLSPQKWLDKGWTMVGDLGGGVGYLMERERHSERTDDSDDRGSFLTPPTTPQADGEEG